VLSWETSLIISGYALEIKQGGQMWDKISAIATLSGVIVTGSGLLFIARQIADSRRFIKAQFINGLDNEILSHHITYSKLFLGEVPKDEELLKFADCLAFFEKIKLLIDNNTIDFKTIDVMFAFRFFLVVHNRHIQDKILYSEKFKGHFLAIFALHKDWVEYRTSRKLKIPYENSSLDLMDKNIYNAYVENYKKSILLNI